MPVELRRAKDTTRGDPSAGSVIHYAGFILFAIPNTRQSHRDHDVLLDAPRLLICYRTDVERNQCYSVALSVLIACPPMREDEVHCTVEVDGNLLAKVRRY